MITTSITAVMTSIFKTVTINGEDKAQELRDFASVIGLEAVAPGRYSLLLVLHLFGAMVNGQLNPDKIVREIEGLERDEWTTGTKPPAPLARAPLKGLWHKHYVPNGIGPFARNLRNGLQKNGLPWFENLIEQAQASGDDRYLEDIHIKQIVHDAVHENWVRRATAGELTGEWIIYAKHDGRNYYLSLGEHKSGDRHKQLRAQIDAVCCVEFPFLGSLLAS